MGKQDTRGPALTHFRMCKVLFDQLPKLGFYILSFNNGSLNLPITAVETKAEALKARGPQDAHKIVLTGKYPYRLWRLGLKDMPIMLLAEHGTLEALSNDALSRQYLTYQSGPGVPNP